MECLDSNQNSELKKRYDKEEWTKMCVMNLNNTLYLSPCKNFTRCDSDGLRFLSATCTSLPEYQTLSALYPGDICPKNWYNELSFRCQCDSKCEGGKCTGKEEGSKCSDKCGCKPNLVCSHSGLCESPKELCSNNRMCARDSACDSGKCIKYFSAQKGTSIEGRTELSQFICESGFIDPRTRKCEDPPVSSNKEGKCVTDSDCSTSLGGYFGRCQCELGASGAKKCASVMGDEEGKQLKDSFKSYLEATSAMHKDHVYNPLDAGSESAYFKYRCARVKYTYFVGLKTRENMDCLDYTDSSTSPLTATLGFFEEYTIYCLSFLHPGSITVAIIITICLL